MDAMWIKVPQICSRRHKSLGNLIPVPWVEEPGWENTRKGRQSFGVVPGHPEWFLALQLLIIRVID
jgi:hypothetical protein